MQNALEGVLVRRAKKEPTDVILNKYHVRLFFFLFVCAGEKEREGKKKREAFITHSRACLLKIYRNLIAVEDKKEK